MGYSPPQGSGSRCVATADVTDRTDRVLGQLTDGSSNIIPALKAQLPAELTTASNLKISIEEAAIVTPVDLQARYGVRVFRSISSPSTDTDYFLPESGYIDLSNSKYSTWFAYAPTTSSMVISACELQISLDGGSTFRKLSGYEISDADFVRDEWNAIKCDDINITYARIRIQFGTAAPSSCELAAVYKV